MIDVDRRAEALARGAAEWRDPGSDVRAQARVALRKSPWSAPVIEAALDDVLRDLDGATAIHAVQGVRSSDERPVLVILPGNVVGPTIASAYCAAAAGARLILKSPGVERCLAPIVAGQFDRLGSPLAGTIDARYWQGGDRTVEAALFRSVRRIVVLGSDETIGSVRQRAGGPDVIAYGSSYSVGFVAGGADLTSAARGAARDVCMFDQRGCMSPQIIYVEGETGRALLFAGALAAALRSAGDVLPRARIEAGEAAAIADRVRRLSIRAMPPRTHGLDSLLLGPSVDGCPAWVVAVEPCGSTSIAGFGRIVSVQPCTGAPPVDRSGHCDTLGFAGLRSPLLDLTIAALSDGRHGVRICRLGEMQRPPFGYRPAIQDFA